KVDDPFLHMKYAFQIMRMAFYSYDYSDVLTLYSNLIGNKSDQSVAFTRILGFKAGAFYHQGNKIKAGYYYSTMFANNKAYKLPALKSFQWAINKKGNRYAENILNQIYRLCKNEHERAVVLEMKLLHTVPFSLEGIKETYALYPEIDGFKVLINREINKL